MRKVTPFCLAGNAFNRLQELKDDSFVLWRAGQILLNEGT